MEKSSSSMQTGVEVTSAQYVHKYRHFSFSSCQFNHFFVLLQYLYCKKRQTEKIMVKLETEEAKISC